MSARSDRKRERDRDRPVGTGGDGSEIPPAEGGSQGTPVNEKPASETPSNQGVGDDPDRQRSER